MDKNEIPSDAKIFDLCKAIYSCDKFFEQSKKEFKGYLIEGDIYNKLKKKLDYDSLKILIEKNGGYSIFKEKIKKRERINLIIPKKYNNSNEFMKELKDKKLYNILTQDLLFKIGHDFQGKDFKCIIYKDEISISFNDNDKICFINNKNGIIEKSSLIQENSNSNDNPSSGPKATDKTETILFKHDLEILIRIFYFNKYLREKENNIFNELKNEENNETIYLINNSWMEEYKSFFDYNTLEQVLSKFFDTNNITDNYYIKYKIYL